MRGVFLFGLLVACETAESTPVPPTPVPPPPVPVDAAPIAVDAAPLVANLRCYYNGPKELIELKTDDKTSMSGLLFRMTTGPVPDREIRYTVKVDGPSSFELIFDRYGERDYWRMWGAKATSPREKMTPGKSVIARVFLRGSKSFIVGVEVDLATGMRIQFPDKAYPCEPYW